MPTLPPPAKRTSSAPSQSRRPNSTWVIIGASRGIGLELVRQVLARGDQVYAAVRDPYRASELWQLAAGHQTPNFIPGACVIHQCDVTQEESINVSFEDCGGKTRVGWKRRAGR
jgi:NAD(P)-dependent dehydrogenase (short-subunit alcohol dehydrogenase family)